MKKHKKGAKAPKVWDNIKAMEKSFQECKSKCEEGAICDGMCFRAGYSFALSGQIDFKEIYNK